MSIYTKTGDKGMTSLFGGKRVAKSDERIETYGSLDELTSFLGFAIARLPGGTDRNLLTDIQKDLYKIMANLSGATTDLGFIDDRVKNFEKRIDAIDSTIPKLTSFLLPQGTERSVRFHIARTVCRRAERLMVKTHADVAIVKYINRLSDLLFTYSRMYNKQEVTVSL